MLRVIAGDKRRLQLKSIEGRDTRPTLDRIKETLFNMIQSDINGSIFVDLFSGTGQIGIEALSRGAKKAYLVELNKKACEVIKYNLNHTGLLDKGDVMQSDVLTAIRRLSDKGVVADFIYIDPPYKGDFEETVLNCLESSSVLGEDTLIIVEAALDTDFSFVDDNVFDIIKVKEYKTNKHLFIKRAM